MYGGYLNALPLSFCFKSPLYFLFSFLFFNLRLFDTKEEKKRASEDNEGGDVEKRIDFKDTVSQYLEGTRSRMWLGIAVALEEEERYSVILGQVNSLTIESGI